MITRDIHDSDRFVLLLQLLNTGKVIGSIQETLSSIDKTTLRILLSGSDKYKRKDNTDPLVELVAYCLNPNHFHLILKQVSENGVPLFLQKFTMAYSKYINTKYQRKGALFYRKYGRRHIATDEYLIHASTYVSLNDRVHGIQSDNCALVRSSWQEYMEQMPGFCNKEVVLASFDNKVDYNNYAMDALHIMRERKVDDAEMKEIGLDL